MKSSFAVLLIGGILSFALWLHFHDKRVQRDATLNAYSDSLAAERHRTRMLQDSLATVDKERDDTIRAMHQRQLDHFRMSQEARLDAQAKADSLRNYLKATGDSGAVILLNTTERKFIETIAHKDSVIASQDHEILEWQAKVRDRDLAISRLNSDIVAATQENTRWKQRAEAHDGLVRQVAEVVEAGLAIYGAIQLVRR